PDGANVGLRQNARHPIATKRRLRRVNCRKRGWTEPDPSLRDGLLFFDSRLDGLLHTKRGSSEHIVDPARGPMPSTSPPHPVLTRALIAALLAPLLCALCASVLCAPLAAVAPGTDPAASGSSIAWFAGDVDSAFARARSERKPLFLYWGASWCPPCNQVK